MEPDQGAQDTTGVTDEEQLLLDNESSSGGSGNDLARQLAEVKDTVSHLRTEAKAAFGDRDRWKQETRELKEQLARLQDGSAGSGGDDEEDPVAMLKALKSHQQRSSQKEHQAAVAVEIEKVLGSVPDLSGLEKEELVQQILSGPFYVPGEHSWDERRAYAKQQAQSLTKILDQNFDARLAKRITKIRERIETGKGATQAPTGAGAATSRPNAKHEVRRLIKEGKALTLQDAVAQVMAR